MRSEIISLCFLCVILKSSSSVSHNYRWVQSFQFNPTQSSPSEEEQIYGFIIDRNASSITVYIKLVDYQKNKLVGTLLHYRTLNAVFAAPRLEWNPSARCYTANETYVLDDIGLVGNQRNRQSILPSLEETIVLDNLRFPGMDYLLDIESYGENDTLWRVATVVRTEAVIPSSPPKTGTGCFHVYGTSENGTRRNVKIYWQYNDDSTELYETLGYENGDSSALVYRRKWAPKEGSILVNIGSSRYTFIFRSVNAAGHSNIFSTVEIPAQEDILPPLRTLVFTNKITHKYLLTWHVPQNVSVRDYTVFWYDTRDSDGGVEFIRDFVNVSKNVNTFKVVADQWIGLAVSVNTDKGSSGLQIASYDEYDLWAIH